LRETLLRMRLWTSVSEATLRMRFTRATRPLRRGGGGDEDTLDRAYLWERKPWTAMARAFLELIAYGLKVLLSLLPPPPGYKAIY
jgi:hypothetical protein